MASKMVSVEDYIGILNLMGAYQWLVDEGDEEGWSSLFTEDGFFHGLPAPFEGREALKLIARSAAEYNGKMRHLIGSMSVQYGETNDEARAKYYCLVTTWMKGEGGKLFNMVLCDVHLLRQNGEWKLKSNSITFLGE